MDILDELKNISAVADEQLSRVEKLPSIDASKNTPNEFPTREELIYHAQSLSDRIKLLIGELSNQPMTNRTISNPHCPWSVEVDGADLVVRNVKATCFGGAYDKGDNGQTESGVLNNGSNPKLMGVALPIRSTEAATRQSPLAFSGPHIPWKTPVLVWNDGMGIPEKEGQFGELIDNGPNVLVYPSHALDMNPEMVAAKFNPTGIAFKRLANDWSGDGFSYRIIGAAKYVS